MTDFSVETGLQLLRDGRIDDARRHCCAALEAEPENFEAQHLLGNVEMQAGDLEAADTALRRALELEEDAATGHNSLGRLLLRREDFPGALTALRRAVKLDESFPEAWCNLGEALGKLGRLDDAAQAFARAVQLRPEYAEAHYNLGVAQEAKGHDQAALASFTEAVRHDPELADARYSLGLLYCDRGQLAEAERHLGECARLRPADGPAQAALGTIFQMQGRLDEAAKAYRLALQCQPDLAQAHSNLGTLAFRRGDLGDAMASFLEARRIEPDHAEALAGMAALYEFKGEYAKAAELLRPEAEKEGSAPEIAIIYGRLTHRLKTPQDGIPALERLVARDHIGDRHRRRACFQLGDLYEQMGRYEDAFSRYKRANAAGSASFDTQALTEQVNGLVAAYSAERWKTLPRLPAQGLVPVFVVGLPLAGSQLVERMLALCDFAVMPGESITACLGPDSDYPQTLSTARLEATRDAYRGRLPAGAGASVDSSVDNGFHLGLIGQLFPDARIIHCRRDPVETVTACYLSNVAAFAPYAQDLPTLTAYYRQYRRIMDHWHGVTGLELLELDVEELIAERALLDRLLAFAGVDADAAGRRKVVQLHAALASPVPRFVHYARQFGPLQAELERATG